MISDKIKRVDIEYARLFNKEIDIWYLNCPYCEKSFRQLWKGQFVQCPKCRLIVK